MSSMAAADSGSHLGLLSSVGSSTKALLLAGIAAAAAVAAATATRWWRDIPLLSWPFRHSPSCPRKVPRVLWRAGALAAGEGVLQRPAVRGGLEPLVLKGVPLGCCRERWTLEHLETSLGDMKVSAHVSSGPALDFAGKNFAYEVMPLRDFLHRAGAAKRTSSDSNGQDFRYYYYRSQHVKRNKPSSLEFLGSLADDFHLPEDLFRDYTVHSTVLRIASAGLRMWLHYDICDNFLCCVRGRKRVALLPPSAISQMYVSGSSSALGSRLFDDDSTRLAQLWREFPSARAAWTARQEVLLEEGDVLFIPALWMHCTQAVASSRRRSDAVDSHEARSSRDEAGGPCISVNVFLVRSEFAELHDPKDVWANRDLLPAQEAFKAFDERMLPGLKRLPAVHRAFYCRKAAAALLAVAADADGDGPLSL